MMKKETVGAICKCFKCNRKFITNKIIVKNKVEYIVCPHCGMYNYLEMGIQIRKKEVAGASCVCGRCRKKIVSDILKTPQFNIEYITCPYCKERNYLAVSEKATKIWKTKK